MCKWHVCVLHQMTTSSEQQWQVPGGGQCLKTYLKGDKCDRFRREGSQISSLDLESRNINIQDVESRKGQTTKFVKLFN